jgi:hypothetical protein
MYFLRSLTWIGATNLLLLLLLSEPLPNVTKFRQNFRHFVDKFLTVF